MSGNGGMQQDKKLFVCTKPYQYLVARLIKKGCGFRNCDLMMLNHFHESKQFCDKVEQLGVWDHVMLYDDRLLNIYKTKLNPLEKYFFYRTWRKFIPEILPDISNYSEVFLAHDGVAAEYAIMRLFQSKRKPAIIFEEGFGNYIDNNTHKTLSKKIMKRCSPLFGLPGGYIGNLKWIDSVWVQHPELITFDEKNPLRNKAKQLPLHFKEYMQMPEIIEELYFIYPELYEIESKIQGEDTFSVILTDLWLDNISNREEFVDHIVDEVKAATGRSDAPIFVKQHPGETLLLEEMPNCESLPQKLPIELLYLIMLRNKLKKVNLFSFGSTAVLNLYDLCRNDENLEIYMFNSVNLAYEYKIVAARFSELASKYHVQYHYV